VPEARSTRRLAALKGAAAHVEAVRPALDLDGWNRRGEFLYTRRLEFPGQAPRVPPAVFDGNVESVEDLLYFDTETTGLSGGAGTLVFLVGTAWCVGTDLEVEQYFLSDFQPDFLAAVKERCGRGAYASFNGRPMPRCGAGSPARISPEIGARSTCCTRACRLWRGLTGRLLEDRGEGRRAARHRHPGLRDPRVYFELLGGPGRPGCWSVRPQLTDVTSLGGDGRPAAARRRPRGSRDGRALGSPAPRDPRWPK
jgi:hypothetical protein